MNETEISNMRKVIKLTLIRIGIRCDLAGFGYLSYAVELAILQPELLKGICKSLYAKIGEKFSIKNNACIERNIRHAIKNTYSTKTFSELNNMFNSQLYTIDDKPTAGELIHLVADYYTLGLYKKILI